MSDTLLESVGLRRSFAGVLAVDDLSVELGTDEVVGLIGPNGAGKSTAINLLSGFDRPDAGRILWQGKDVGRASASRLAGLGLVRTFQHVRLFDSLTVRENIEVAAQTNSGVTAIESLFGAARHRRAQRAQRSLVNELLAGFELRHLADHLATDLPYGDQRRVEIVRALATRAKALLLDEPAAGMDEAEAASLTDFLEHTRRQHQVAVLLVEHHMDVVTRFCHRVIVMENGRAIAAGTPEQVMNDPVVLEAYTGEEPT